MSRLLALTLAAVVTVLLAAAPAGAWPDSYPQVAGNPADALARLPIEPVRYDRATGCQPKAKPGMTALVTWLERHSNGVFWGTYRCERWGKGSASLHAENRAVDWHLNASSSAGRREADRLIAVLLAPDKAGAPQALARRMGIEELIWDCGYWSAGMSEHRRYSPCLSKAGRVRRHVNTTIAHRDHIHIGMTKPGAAKRTSFWTRRASPDSEPYLPVAPDLVWPAPDGQGAGGELTGASLAR